MFKGKKLKVVKKNRNEISVDKFKKEQKEKEYGKKLVTANQKIGFVRNTVNGRYYFARCNMIADQLNAYSEKFSKLNDEQKNDSVKLREIEEETIKEKIDGNTKSYQYLLSEYGLMKVQAIESFRNAHFAKKELIEEHKLSSEEVDAFLDDYYNGKIIRDEYDERKPKSKAEFVNS